MIAWEILDSAVVPGGGELRLKRRGAEYSIMLGMNELMNSRLSGSEEALARLSCVRITGRQHASILIGGLGMGFTLRAAMAAMPQDTRFTVAELVPAIITWARGPMADIFARCLDDKRVTLVEADVGALIRAGRQRYDAILLDVDNGPDGLSRKANDALYNRAGLAEANAALTDGGILSVWSSGPDAAFTRRLSQTGFAVEEVAVRANGKRGARHVIWLATKSASRA